MDSLERLAAARVTVAVAESLTCGLLSSAVGRGEDASGWFAGGVVAYFTRVKEDVLGVTPGTDPCSPECAEQLADGVRLLLGAQVAVSTTGVGGPEPEGGHDAGTVFLGWATPDATGHVRLALDGGPDEILEATVERALEVLADLAEERRPRRAGLN